MADFVLRALLSDMILYMADEATDIKFNKQMGVAIRWVDEVYEVHEGPLGLLQVTRTDARTLTTAMTDVLTHCMLPLSQCRGQAYNEASNMED